MKLITTIKNMFNAAALAARGTGTVTITEKAQSLVYGKLPQHERSVTPMLSEAYTGEVTPDVLSDLRSNKGKNAIAQLGAWSSVAKGFNAYMKQMQQREQFRNFSLVWQHIAEFHAWNASNAESSNGYFVRESGEAYGENLGGQMSSEETEVILAKLAVLPVPKGDDNTDAILAQVRRCSIDQLREERKKDMDRRSALRIEGIANFNQMLWSRVDDEQVEVSMPLIKAVSKLIQTMEWVASWSSDPAAAAGEVLLLQQDIKFLEQTCGSKDEEREPMGETQGRRKNPRFDQMMDDLWKKK